MTEQEWKEAQELAARCVEDPWTISFINQAGALEDKNGFGVVEVYIDDRRLELTGHINEELDDARDIEAMRRLFPKLVDQCSARDAMPDKLRAVYEAARKWRFGGGDYGRAEVEHELEAAIDALEPPA